MIYPINKLFAEDSIPSYKTSFIYLIFFFISLSLIFIYLDFPPINAMPWDVIIQLDAAWRVVNGQIINVDFSPIIPPFSIMVTAIAMQLKSPSVSSILYGNLLLFITITPWAWFIARTRFSAIIAFLFAAFIGILLITPRALGDHILATSYAMIYNRQAWAFISMLLIELLIPPKQNFQSKQILSSLSSGILLALLLFNKLSFLAIGITAILIHIVFFFPRKTWFFILICSFLTAWFSIQAFFHWNLFAYLNEMRQIAPVYSSTRLGYWQKIYLKNFLEIGLVGLTLFFLLLIDFKLKNGQAIHKKWQSLARIIIITIFIVVAVVIIIIIFYHYYYYFFRVWWLSFL
jgi:hypothetical protein